MVNRKCPFYFSSEVAPEEFLVRAGSNYAYREGETRSVVKVINHPDYNRDMVDVSLLKLASPFALSESIGTIALSTSMPLQGEVVVSGYGRIKENGLAAPHLMSAKLQLADHGTCVKQYQVVNLDVKDHMICAAEPGKDSCQGDSGGKRASI